MDITDRLRRERECWAFQDPSRNVVNEASRSLFRTKAEWGQLIFPDVSPKGRVRDRAVSRFVRDNSSQIFQAKNPSEVGITRELAVQKNLRLPELKK